MTLKYKIIILVVTLIIAFFSGRLTVNEKIVTVTEMKIEKIRDEEAIARAVALERKKILRQTKQKKIINTIKLPDGTIKTHKEIANEHISQESMQISSVADLNVASHEIEKSTLKTARNDFKLDIQMGIENYITFQRFEPNLNVTARASYRLTENIWSFVEIEHEMLSNNNYIKIGAMYQLIGF